jgi:hypothetical protein
MSGLPDVLNSGRVLDVFEQVVGFRLFGISAFFSRDTGFRVFIGSHGFSCLCQFTRLSVSHGFPCFRVFGVFPPTHGNSCFSESHGLPFHTEFRVFVFSASHGILYHTDFRVSVFSPSHEVPTACLSCGPSDDPVHAPLFAPCVTSTLLVGIGPS